MLTFHQKAMLVQIPIYDFDYQHQQKNKELYDIYLFLKYYLLQLYYDNVNINLADLNLSKKYEIVFLTLVF